MRNQSINTTRHVLATTTAAQRQSAYGLGIEYANEHQRPTVFYTALSKVRARYGFIDDQSKIRVTTKPTDNAKTEKATALEYGVTLQSATTCLCDGRVFESCPNRGACTGMCVLNNGNGAYPATQRARDAKLHMMVDETFAFIVCYAYEIQTALIRQWRSDTPRAIINRPKINDDLSWHLILPALADDGWGGRVTSLGYTKDPEIFDVPGGWHGPYFRESYSISEKSDLAKVRRFVLEGGNATIVHGGKKGAPVPAEGIRHYLGLPPWVPVFDTDKTDETILQRGPGVNALTAKGKARKTKSRFVVRDFNSGLQSIPVHIIKKAVTV
jgi:hypothetical protein